MADQVTGGAGPEDRPYPNGNVEANTPEEINRRGDSEHPKAPERQPLLANEDDQPDSDALGG